MDDAERARALLGGEALEWLVQRLRKRLQQGESLTGRLSLGRPSEEQRQAVYRLLGTRPRRATASLTVNVGELALLFRDLGLDLASSVVALTGPLQEPKSARQAGWVQLERDLVGHVPVLQTLLLGARGREWLRQRARGDAARVAGLFRPLSAVTARLPAAGLTLAELAAQATGDSHALDQGRLLGWLASRVAATLSGLDPGDRALDRRFVWARVGVLCDELSVPALTLGLNAVGDTFTDDALRRHTRAGQPYRLSLRQLLREPPVLADPLVFVCENPAVLAAAADRLGAACRPLLCTEGQPRSAVCHLLAGLSCRVVYHGDFDWPGIRIANLMVYRFGAEPWRMGREDYLAAVGRGRALQGVPATPLWDEGLRTAMVERGRVVHEEQVVEGLLGDLRV